jgi:leucyl/phenylalanyl-tRNA--protein transferase
LLAVGGSLDVPRLVEAYGNGIFPWFNRGQPILWWSPDPRMVLVPSEFRLHRSLRKTLRRFRTDPDCAIRVDYDFSAVIRACAKTKRNHQDGTWIVSSIVEACEAFHHAGFAHSVETWMGGRLVGGLYFISLGLSVFGESMFYWQKDASKIALSALICMCVRHGVEMIDCQQDTRHLEFLGGRSISRKHFLKSIRRNQKVLAPHWTFQSDDWEVLK